MSHATKSNFAAETTRTLAGCVSRGNRMTRQNARSVSCVNTTRSQLGGIHSIHRSLNRSRSPQKIPGLSSL